VKKKKAKAESGIVSMSAAPSDYLGQGASLRGLGDCVDRYVSQLVDPWTGGGLTRVPDANMRPTALARFFANRTYTIPSTTNGTNFLFGMHSCMASANAGRIQELSNLYPSSPSTAPFQVGQTNTYAYTPGNILSMGQFPDAGAKSALTLVNGTQLPWGDDFGAEQLTTMGWVAAYRLISGAMRVRVVGLPSGQFMTPGKIYFGQIRWNLDDVPSTEQDWTQLERLGYATHVSLDAVREAGSKTFFFLPDGTDKFELRSNFWPAPGSFNALHITDVSGGTPSFESYIRRFPTLAEALANGNALQGVVPFGATTTGGQSNGPTADVPDQQQADQTMCMLVAVFGTQAGVVLEVDYAQIHEYVATPNAPPGIDTAIQLPSSVALDQIFASSAVIGEMRGAMVQAAGDKTILDVPSKMFGPDHGGIRAEGKRTKSAILSNVRHHAGGTLRKGRAEGFWDFDWLSKGNLGGLSWDFSSGSSKGKSKP
jgi:hypothetical protein